MVATRSSRLREAEVTSDPSRESPTVGRRSGWRHIVDAEERIISPAIRNRHSSVGNKRRRREGHWRYQNSECRLKRRCVSPVADRSSNDGHESESSMSVNVSASEVTGLPCGPYPDQLTIDSSQRQAEGAAPFLNTLLGAEVDVTIEGIVNILKAEPGMDGWKKLRLVLIVIVEGILICGTQPIRPGLAYVEMVKNLDFFLSFPWGRLAFERTVRMLQVGDKICTQSTIVKKLKQKSLVVHDRLVSTLPPLKTYHTENILAVENDDQLEVFQNINLTAVDMCGSISDGSFSDPNVKYMLKLIHGGYSFSKADWVGGDDSLDKLCICKKKSDMPCNCGSSFAYDDKGKSAAGTCTSGGVDNGSEIAKLWVEVAWMKKLQCSSIGMLRASIVSDIYSLVGLTKCLNCRSSPRICHAEYPLSVRTGSEACGAQAAELLYSCHQNDSVVDEVLPQPPDAHKFYLSPDNVQICTGNVHADLLPGQVPNDLLLTESSRSQTVSPCNVLVPAPALHCCDRVSQKLDQCRSHLNPIDCTLPMQLLSDRCRVPPRKICSGSLTLGKKHLLSIPLRCGYIPFRPPQTDLISRFKEQLHKYRKSSFMAPLVRMLPHLIMSACEPDDIEHVDSTFFSYSRLDGLAQNTRGGDCGAYVIKFIEMHCHGYEANHLSHFSNLMVDNFRMEFALDVYKDFIGKLRVQ
ncbi:hypothetical protein ARALYDRAFT_902578 [Arabidopsis lyrata subsp. lyrata]|uniref:Ubiquitin-like protease family profile domain-containing protein n=1 Tax=Arabidopsis lyrata subsp. lyrata TaxID=81972 RepID=D7LHP6_ARALL|nr:hypothetical protein ARALYDRAFT_902578 [Arabidopsis lyrata subsp. lyrata]